MSDLLQSLQTLIPEETLSRYALQLNETEQDIRKAINGMYPALLQSLIQSDSKSHVSIADLLQRAASLPDIQQDVQTKEILISQVGWPKTGDHFTQLLFGERRPNIVQGISNQAGIQFDSATFLLQSVSAYLISFLSHKMHGDGLQLQGILNWLSEKEEEIRDATPYILSQILNANHVQSFGKGASAKTNFADADHDSSLKWILPIILLGLLATGIWYWIKGSQAAHAPSPETDVKHNPAPEAFNYHSVNFNGQA
jgi:hypothetical protein